jgi:hypothetical protein
MTRMPSAKFRRSDFRLASTAAGFGVYSTDMATLPAKLAVVAVTVFLCASCQGQQSGQPAGKFPVTLSAFGGGCCFQVDDTLTIAPNGAVKYVSVTPNYVELKRELPGMGEYAAQVDPSVYESIAKLAREEIGSGKSSPLPHDSLAQAVSFDTTKEGRTWVCCKATLDAAFAKLRDAAIQNPIRVLALECDQSAKGLNCRYKNIGKQAVATVDPINVASIACRPQSLSAPRATPKVINIAPGKTYDFAIGRDQLPGDQPCEVIRIDSRYAKVAQEDVLLLELHAKIRAGGR